MATDMTDSTPSATSVSPATTHSIADVVRVRIPEGDYTEFKNHLIREEADEHAGYLVAGVHRYTERDGAEQREVLEYLVQDVVCLEMDEYADQGAHNVTLDHSTLREATFKATPDDRYLEDRAIILAHSHPFQRDPSYSSLDDSSEPMAFVALTAEGEGPQASLLFGADDTLAGRVWPADVGRIRDEEVAGTNPIDEIVVVGNDQLKRIQTTNSRLDDSEEESEMHDRQALVHGDGGNAALRSSHVAVVGAGGLGSLVVQSLAHLGVGTLTVVDPDVVEETNRSRIVGARPDDAGPADATPDGSGVTPAMWAEAFEEAGRPKVEVMQRLVEEIDPSIQFNGVHQGVESPDGMDAILKADVIVSATDTASSRVALSHAAKQYHRPLFDAGTNINVVEGTAKYIATRLTVVTPSSPCLDCHGEINWDRVTAEQQNPDEIEYGLELIEGEAPAVITINQQAAARLTFAVHRYLSGLLAGRTGFNTGTDELITGFHETPETESDPACKFCGDGPFAGIGDRGPSPAKPSRMEVPDDTGIISELGIRAVPEVQHPPSQQSVEEEEKSLLGRVRGALASLLR